MTLCLMVPLRTTKERVMGAAFRVKLRLRKASGMQLKALNHPVVGLAYRVAARTVQSWAGKPTSSAELQRNVPHTRSTRLQHDIAASVE